MYIKLARSVCFDNASQVKTLLFAFPFLHAYLDFTTISEAC